MPLERLKTEDAEILRRIRDRAEDAFPVLVHAYQDRVFNTVFRCTGDRHAAEDMTQDIFMKILGGLAGFHGKSALSTWIYRITLNHCASEARRLSTRKRKAEVSLTGADASGEESAIDPGDSSGDPFRKAEDAEKARMIQAAISSLDPEFRESLVLRDVEGFSYEEIAEIIGKPVGTVRSRIHRARLTLRDSLKKYISCGGENAA